MATARPAPERVADLTYETATPAPAEEATPRDQRLNIIFSVLLAATIGVLWIAFPVRGIAVGDDVLGERSGARRDGVTLRGG